MAALEALATLAVVVLVDQADRARVLRVIGIVHRRQCLPAVAPVTKCNLWDGVLPNPVDIALHARPPPPRPGWGVMQCSK